MTVEVLALSVAIGAFLLNLVLMPAIIRYAHKKKWYDGRNARKVHTDDVPRLGGVGMFVAFFIAAIVGFALMPDGGDGTIARPLLSYLPVFVGILVMHTVGLFDDFKNLPALKKLLIQILAGVIVTLGPHRISSIVLPFNATVVSFGWLSYPITIVWIISIANAMNLIDGVDGLAGGVALIAAGFAVAIGLVTAQNPMLIGAAALVGAVLGFLVFNKPPARIFMGDSGSLFLGTVLAVLPFLAPDEAASALNIVPIVTLILVPVFDTAAAIIRRVRDGRPVHEPDRKHLHHKLMDLGFSAWGILGVVYGAGVLLGIAAVLWYTPGNTVGAVAIILAWALALAGFIVLDRVKHTE